MAGFFMMTPEVAEKFFERCLYKEAITEPERMEILRAMEVEGLILARGSLAGTKDDLVKEIAKHANVLVVKNKERKPHD